jgi:hypothetical protein
MKHHRMFNASVLSNLEEQIGPQSMDEAFAYLLADVRSGAETLANCLDTGDEARARRAGHKLKGIIEQYGIRDPEDRASNLSGRYDLYWINECTALYALCQALVDEIRKIQQARAVSNDDTVSESSRKAV